MRVLERDIAILKILQKWNVIHNKFIQVIFYGILILKCLSTKSIWINRLLLVLSLDTISQYNLSV